MTTRIIYGLTYRQYLRLLRQCYRHGFYCTDEYVADITENRHITLQKCNYCVHLVINDSFSDIWGQKHTWTNYLQSKGVI